MKSFLKSIHLDTMEKICMSGLMLFMIMFTGYSMFRSSNAAYRLTDYSLFYLKSRLVEHIVPIDKTVLMQTLILMIVAWVLLIILKKLELPSISIIVPLFVLLTISCLFQDYTRKASNANKHFAYLLLGLIFMLFGICFAKFQSFRDERKRRLMRFFLWSMLLNCMLLFLWSIGSRILGLDVNGAYGIVKIPKIGTYTPVEWQKLFILLFTGVALTDLRMNRKLRKHYYCLMLFSIISVLISKDFGNLIILLMLMGIVLYLMDNKRGLLWATILIAFATAILFILHRIGLLPSMLGYLFDRIYSVITVSTEASANSTRQALIATLRNGIWGSGPATKMYIDNVYAIYTDYAFIAIQTIFGIGISFLVIICYIELFLCFGTGYKDAQSTPLIYFYSNTLGSVLMVQAIVHVAVNLDIFPYTGVVLPFISAGGTSTLMSFLCVGMMLGVRVGDVPYTKCVEWIKNRWLYKACYIIITAIKNERR